MKKYISLLFLSMTIISCAQAVKEGHYRGQDHLGETKECSPMAQKMCTEIFTQEDKFAMDCREAGNQAIQCDCHKWICITK